MTTRKTRYAKEGYDAYKSGKPIVDNPYTDRLRNSEWRQGWLSASHTANLVKMLIGNQS